MGLLSSDWDGDRFQRRFDELEASGEHVHGEADFIMGLGGMEPGPRSVLDAGCGTGRVAIELARRGVLVVGVDSAEPMIEVARRRAPDLDWVVGDLADLRLERTFDAVVMAGNVPLFTPAGTQGALVAGCARHVAPDGALVCGFSLGREYGLTHYDADCDAAGLVLDERFATWSRDPFEDGDYAVSVHRHA